MSWDVGITTIPERDEDYSSMYGDVNTLMGDIQKVLDSLKALAGNGEDIPDNTVQELAAALDGAAKSTDGTFAANSDAKIPTEKAVKTYVDGEISGIVTDMAPPEVRQTVLMGAVDSSGYAAFLSEETADNISILGATTNCIMSIANGITNYNYTEDEDVTPAAWANLTGIGIWFLYADYDTATEAVTYDKTRVRPQYGQRFDKTKNILMHFDGDNASTDMVDVYGNTCTAYGNAQLSTGDKKFGVSSLELGGAGDYIGINDITSLGDRFCIEFWFHTDNNTTDAQTPFSAMNASNYGINIQYRSGAGNLQYSLSTNGSSWNIVAGGSGAKTSYTNNQWYHLRMEWDGATFKVYIDGILDYSIALTSPICAITKIHIGANGNPTDYLDGGIDEFRMDIGYTRDEEAFTPAAAAYSPDAIFFDINKMKMYEGAPGAWTEKIRLFLGEAIMAGNHVSSVITYALKGYYDSGGFPVVYATTYIKNHNIGCELIEHMVYGRQQDAYNWQVLANQAYASYTYGSASANNRKQVKVHIATYADSMSQVEVGASYNGNVQTSGYYYKVVARRSF